MCLVASVAWGLTWPQTHFINLTSFSLRVILCFFAEAWTRPWRLKILALCPEREQRALQVHLIMMHTVDTLGMVIQTRELCRRRNILHHVFWWCLNPCPLCMLQKCVLKFKLFKEQAIVPILFYFEKNKIGTITCSLNNINFWMHFCSMLKGQYTRQGCRHNQNTWCTMLLLPQSSLGSTERAIGLDGHP